MPSDTPHESSGDPTSIDFGLHFSCSSLEGGDWPDLYDQAIQQAARGEDVGFSYALVAEHHFKNDGWIPSPFLLAASIARATSKVKVGTDIVIAPLHHPIEIAENMVVLDNLSRGRAVCGIGLGAAESEFDAYGVPFTQRVSRTEEAMAIVAGLMTGEPFSHDGKYLQLSDIRVTPGPVSRPRPLILYGAQSKPGAVRAARLADRMVVAPHVALDGIPTIRETYQEQLQAEGARPRPTLIRREGFVAQTSTEAKKIGYGALRDQYSRIYSHVSENSSAKAFEEYLQARFVVGDPEEVAEQLVPYIEAAGAETVLFRFQLPGVDPAAIDESIDLLGKEVRPRLEKLLGY